MTFEKTEGGGDTGGIFVDDDNGSNIESSKV